MISSGFSFIVVLKESIGLLMQTEVANPDKPGETDVLSQFLHLSIQEFLAMAGLLKQDLSTLRDSMTWLVASEQFNMALLFIYGLAFNESNDAVRKISDAVTGKSEKPERVQDILKQVLMVSDLGHLQQLCEN